LRQIERREGCIDRQRQNAVGEATSSFSRLRVRGRTGCRPFHRGDRCRHDLAASAASITGFAWSCARAVAANTKVQSAMANSTLS